MMDVVAAWFLIGCFIGACIVGVVLYLDRSER